MSEQESRDSTENPKTESAAEQVSPKAAVRRLALAGIGVVATAADVTDEVFNDLVRRGEESRQEALRELKAAREAKCRTPV